MALLHPQIIFNADALHNQVIGIAADVGIHDSGMHQHAKGQLLYAPAGCISITLDNMQCVLPPTRAAWIPAGVQHCARMHNVVAYRSLYFAPELTDQLPERIKIIAVNRLLQALIERMAFWSWDKPAAEQTNTLALFFDELGIAPEQYFFLPLPTDPRLSTWLVALRQQRLAPLPLARLQLHIGASGKTISRIFSRETGMPYQAWRQQWRLQRALERLAEGDRISTVAFALDFASDSAFISFFHQHTGTTPAQYLKKQAAY